MRHLRVAALALASVLLSSSLAQALVRIDINLNDQSMHVTAADGEDYVWPISSGRRGFPTPTGNYRPQYMTPLAISYKYHNTPMPHSIFFRGGYAIHATAAVGSLGRPASHGCVRLSPANAATLYALVRQEKMANTRIALVGEVPRTNELIAKRSETVRGDSIMQDEDFTGALPGQRKLRVTRDGWREIPNQRDYFYTERRYDAPRRYYRYGGDGFFPFGR